MIKRLFIHVLCLLCLVPALAQEGLKPLTGRINSLYQDLPPGKQNLHNATYKTQSVSLQIPFLDDFSYASTSLYPDQNLWDDSLAYVNSGYPIAAPSIGVATFDGLNKHGYPYTPTLTTLTYSGPADTLTSKPINLNIVAASSQTLLPSDSIALSFYYQARGRGETPEPNDSLLLDFFAPGAGPAGRWINMWGKRGNINGNINDTIFKRVYIKIDSTIFLADGFRFRFRNKATTSGDFDHWHVDYIYLNKNRTRADTVFNDMTFGEVPTSFLKHYSAMPYQQYVAAENASNYSVRIKNNNNAPVNYLYENRFYNPAHSLIYNYFGGSNQSPPTLNSSVTYTNHSYPLFPFVFPPMSDSTDFTIKHYVYRSNSATSDFLVANDTVTQFQRFRNYFALDDGSAEAGYYVNGVGGKMAVKVTLNVKDTLRALRIYFDPEGTTVNSPNSYSFVINVWGAGASGPGAVVYTDILKMPLMYYNTGFRESPEYKLSNMQVLPPGVYYIGIQQKVATGITVGYDLNLNHSQSVYYDSGSGWTESALGGSLMIRPVFGKFVPTPVGIAENSAIKNRAAFAYPNPASDQLVIHADKTENMSYILMNTMGQTLKTENILTNEHNINTTDLSNGVYFLVIKENNRLVQQQKIIIQH